MDTFEKQLAKQQLEILKTINRNLNYIGRKLEMINTTLEKHGIAVMPTVETGDNDIQKGE
jgi:hypothetical protein